MAKKETKEQVLFKTFHEAAARVGLKPREFMLADEHNKEAASIFYDYMPAILKQTLSQEKFNEYFSKYKNKIIQDLEAKFGNLDEK